MVKYSTNINDHNTNILNIYTNGENGLNDLIMVSLASKRPIAQFILDTCKLYILKYDLPINDFMEQSKLLSMLSNDSKPWKIIRRYLCQYMKYFYLPIGKHMNEITPKHNTSGILYYISIIHDNIIVGALNKVCQIDIVFIPQKLDWINDAYFDNLGVKYERLIYEKGMRAMMKRFNTKSENNKVKRCVILIMENKYVCNDTVYIFEPLNNNSSPPEISNYTEIPWISNTKSNILPNLSLVSNALCLSVHRYIYDNPITERVYLSYGNYGCRVFKYNLREMINPFCMNKSEHPMIDWEREINEKEFIDHQYSLFVDTFFADLQLTKEDMV